jgi:hypothetical protein
MGVMVSPIPYQLAGQTAISFVAAARATLESSFLGA